MTDRGTQARWDEVYKYTPLFKGERKKGDYFPCGNRLAHLANERDRIIYTINMKAHMSLLSVSASLSECHSQFCICLTDPRTNPGFTSQIYSTSSNVHEWFFAWCRILFEVFSYTLVQWHWFIFNKKIIIIHTKSIRIIHYFTVFLKMFSLYYIILYIHKKSKKKNVGAAVQLHINTNI